MSDIDVDLSAGDVDLDVELNADPTLVVELTGTSEQPAVTVIEVAGPVPGAGDGSYDDTLAAGSVPGLDPDELTPAVKAELQAVYSYDEPTAGVLATAGTTVPLARYITEQPTRVKPAHRNTARYIAGNIAGSVHLGVQVALLGQRTTALEAAEPELGGMLHLADRTHYAMCGGGHWNGYDDDGFVLQGAVPEFDGGFDILEEMYVVSGARYQGPGDQNRDTYHEGLALIDLTSAGGDALEVARSPLGPRMRAFIELRAEGQPGEDPAEVSTTAWVPILVLAPMRYTHDPDTGLTRIWRPARLLGTDPETPDDEAFDIAWKLDQTVTSDAPWPMVATAALTAKIGKGAGHFLIPRVIANKFDGTPRLHFDAANATADDTVPDLVTGTDWVAPTARVAATNDIINRWYKTASSATVGDDSVTNAKLANMAEARIKGRISSGTGDPEDLTAAQTRTLLALGAAALLNVGTTAGTVAAGDDARFTDTRTPTDNTVATAKLVDDAVTNPKLANMGEATLKGRAAGAGTGDPTDLTPTQARTLLNVADGATANSPDATLLARGNHTGTQPASTISDFATAADARITAQRGVADGVASLDSGGKVPVTQLPNSVMQYQGTWNATTNSPTLADGAGSIGDVYRVTVAGTQNLGSGAITFDVGDYAVLNASLVWEKSDTTDSVPTVFGRTGNVVAADADYSAAQVTASDSGLLVVTGFTRVQAAIAAIDAALDARYTKTAADARYSRVANNLSDLADAATARTNLGLGAAATRAIGTSSGQIRDAADAAYTNERTPSDLSVVTGKLGANAVTNAKLAQMAEARIKGRVSTGTGDPEDLTGTQVRGILGSGTADSTTYLRGDGVWTAPAATVADDSVTNAKLANVSTSTIKGRSSSGTGDPEDLTGAQARAIIEATQSIIPGYKSTWWYPTPYAVGPTANTLIANRIYAIGFYVTEEVTFDRIGLQVTTGVASSVVQPLVYSVGTDGLPSALLVSSWATIATASTGFQEATISWAPTPYTLYWVCGYTTSTGVAVRATTVPAIQTGATAGSNAVLNTLTPNGTFSGSAPDPFGTPTSGAFAPVFAFRAS